jgi:hypothetical protein
LNIQCATIAYAGIGIAGYDASSVEVQGSSIVNADLGVQFYGNVATLRVDFLDDTQDVDACVWGSSDCSVDATYSYWGNTDGPVPSGQSPLACGAVSLSPWYTSLSHSSTAASPIFADGNCDGRPTPDEALASAQQAAAIWLAEQESQCAQDGDSACEVVQQYLACFAAIVALARSAAGFPFSGATDVVGAGATFLEASADAVIETAGYVLDYASAIIGVATTIYQVVSAYQTCT